MPAPAGDSDPSSASSRARRSARPDGPTAAASRSSRSWLADRLTIAIGVFRDELDAFVGPRLDPRVGAHADGHVQRLRAGMEEIDRPDVDRAARQVDAGGRGRRDSHGAIIIPGVIMPLASRRDIGQLSDRQYSGQDRSRRVSIARARVRSRRGHSLRPQHRGA